MNPENDSMARPDAFSLQAGHPEFESEKPVDEEAPRGKTDLLLTSFAYVITQWYQSRVENRYSCAMKTTAGVPRSSECGRLDG